MKKNPQADEIGVQVLCSYGFKPGWLVLVKQLFEPMSCVWSSIKPNSRGQRNPKYGSSQCSRLYFPSLVVMNPVSYRYLMKCNIHLPFMYAQHPMEPPLDVWHRLIISAPTYPTYVSSSRFSESKKKNWLQRNCKWHPVCYYIICKTFWGLYGLGNLRSVFLFWVMIWLNSKNVWSVMCDTIKDFIEWRREGDYI